MAVGNHNGAGQPPRTFGTYASGPKVAVAHAGATMPMPIGRALFGASKVMPSHETLDYLHKLSSTTVLLVGLAAFLVLGPRGMRGKLRSIATRHVGSP